MFAPQPECRMNSSGSGNVKISVSLTWTSPINGTCRYRHDSMYPLKRKCANKCWLLTIGEIEAIVGKGRGKG